MTTFSTSEGAGSITQTGGGNLFQVIEMLVEMSSGQTSLSKERPPHFNLGARRCSPGALSANHPACVNETYTIATSIGI
jgi:hypothetical protein